MVGGAGAVREPGSLAFDEGVKATPLGVDPARVSGARPPRVWIIDEEWGSVDVEIALLTRAHPGAEILHSTYDYAEDLESFGRTCDILIAQVYAGLPAATIERLECCRGIAVMGGGFDRVDVQAASARGIPVTNVQGYCAEDLAQYVVTAILTDAKPLVEALGPQGPTPWGLLAYHSLPRRVADRTLLVVGYGRIGRTVARRALGLGMRVLATDPHVPAETMAAEGVEWVTWEQGFPRADVVSVHCALTPATRGIIGARELAAMPEDSLLVNTARGAVIDEDALVAALRAGGIRAAVLDVINHEPPDFTEEIFRTPGARVTPHVSYLSYESITELRSRSVHNALAMYEGRIPDDCVNAGTLLPPRPIPSDWKE